MSLRTRKIVYSGVAIALATVAANFLKLPSLPFHGSATLFSMLFICLVGYWFGPVYGLLAGVAHGMIQFVSNPYILHWIQVILDYPLAFGALGLSGFFYKKKNGLLLGYTVGVLGRFLVASIAGVIFYTTYTGDFLSDTAAIWAGVLYNMTYIVPEYIMTMIVLAVPAVRKALARVKREAVS